MKTLIFAAMFLVTLQPQHGTPGGPVRVKVEAHDANIARTLARAQYEPAYRVTNVQRTK
jgi:hypothetical protein